MESRFWMRGWHKQDNRYIYNIVVSNINNEITISERLKDGRTVLIPRDKIILELYTGLRDRVGEYLFEGDIVYSIKYNKEFNIEWDEEYCCFNITRRIGGVKEIKMLTYEREDDLMMVGNIHEKRWKVNEQNI